MVRVFGPDRITNVRMRIDRVRTLGDNDIVRAEMSRQCHRSFNESEELLKIVSNGDAYWCRSGSLQPMMVEPFNYRQIFSIWNNGDVTVYDNRWHKRDLKSVAKGGRRSGAPGPGSNAE
ncbi:uncharacterized protein Dvar_58930 [Desulfosarcina variabilis str. Montpellier]